MSHSDSPLNIWSKAGKIAKSDKDAHGVWTQLKSWAMKQESPVAMKAAVFEFLAVYGTSPKAAPLLPEVFREAAHISSALPENEKKVLVELADLATAALKSSYSPISTDPRDFSPNLPVRDKRPSLMLSFRPDVEKGIYAPLTPSADADGLIKARETMMRVNDMLLNMNMKQDPRVKEKESADVGVLNAATGSDRGEELIQSLIEKMKSHAAEEETYRYKTEEEPPKKKKAKKKKTAKKKPKKKAKKKAKKKPAKKKAAPKKKAAKKKPQKKKAKKKPAKKATRKKPAKKAVKRKAKRAKKKTAKKRKR
jgi:hypothetical protein